MLGDFLIWEEFERFNKTKGIELQLQGEFRPFLVRDIDDLGWEAGGNYFQNVPVVSVLWTPQNEQVVDEIYQFQASGGKARSHEELIGGDLSKDVSPLQDIVYSWRIAYGVRDSEVAGIRECLLSVPQLITHYHQILAYRHFMSWGGEEVTRFEVRETKFVDGHGSLLTAR